MTLKRLAASTAAAAVLLASPCQGWTMVPSERGNNAGARIRPFHGAARSDVSSSRQATISRNMAASIVEGPVGQDYTSSDSTGWHHRVLRKVFRRRRRHGMEMKGAALALQEAELQQALDLMGRPFDLSSSQQQIVSLALDFPSFQSELDPISNPVIDVDTSVPMHARMTAPGVPVDAPSVSANTLEDSAVSDSVSLPESNDMITSRIVNELSPTTEFVDAGTLSDGGSPFVRITRPWVQNILVGLLDRWSQGSHVNLNVNCNPQSKTLDLVQGRFACDASVDFDRIIFGPIRMHRGRIEVNRMALGILSLTPSAIPLRGRRYLNQFEFYGRNVTFTQQDLVESRCIRNGLKNLLARILKLQGTKAVRISIETIDILPNGKISCRGAAKTGFGKILEFEVRSGLGFTSRGHILTFPGLEISLSPGLKIFVPVLPAISLDLGHNAQLLDLNIDGQAAEMIVSAKVTIAPHHTLKLRKYKQSQDAYLAQYSVDVGRWLTRLGNFTS